MSSGTLSGMRMRIDEHGPYCPRCGGRQFQKRSVLQWRPTQTECVACGKVLKPASASEARRARDRSRSLSGLFTELFRR